MEVYWAYAQENPGLCDKASAILEPAGQEETEPTQTNMETISKLKIASA